VDEATDQKIVSFLQKKNEIHPSILVWFPNDTTVRAAVKSGKKLIKTPLY
jgi:hypothetical protein